MKYREMTAEQRKAEFEKVSAEFEAWKAKGLKLNMAGVRARSSSIWCPIFSR